MRRWTLPLGGHRVANPMGEYQTGDVYHLEWITLVPVRENLFKLVSNSGADVGYMHGANAENIRAAVKDTLVVMSPEFGRSRCVQMNVSFVSHMRVTDISQDNSNAYKGTVIVPCCFLMDVRSLGDT